MGSRRKTTNRLSPQSSRQVRSRTRWVKRLFVLIPIAALVLWMAGVIIYQTHKPLPKGLSYASREYTVDHVDFLTDLTLPDGKGGMVQERQIADRVFQMIGEAKKFAVLDLFLMNAYINKSDAFPEVSNELVDRLIRQKQLYPSLKAVLITDEINTDYGSSSNPLLERLQQAGIKVTITNLNALRDPTPLYSAVWRSFIQWFGQGGTGRIPNLMASGGPDISVRSYLKLLNVKANHRKVLVTENGALITSANVHNASAFHSNIAFEVNDSRLIRDILDSEQAVLSFSGGGQLPNFVPAGNLAPAAWLASTESFGSTESLTPSRNLAPTKSLASTVNLTPNEELAPTENLPSTKNLAPTVSPTPTVNLAPTKSLTSIRIPAAGVPSAKPDHVRENARPIRIQYLTEGKINRCVHGMLNHLSPGDTLWMGMFYLGDDRVLKELKTAADRGVKIRLLLDPNQNAFGRRKIGIPNRPVARRLLKHGGDIQIRWYNCTKEQYHTKLIYAAKQTGDSFILGGSANLTVRNLRDYNLENAIRISAPPDTEPMQTMNRYFTKLWYNQGGEYSQEYGKYAETKTVWIKELLFDLQNLLYLTTY